jgi:hypothetical protein
MLRNAQISVDSTAVKAGLLDLIADWVTPLGTRATSAFLALKEILLAFAYNDRGRHDLSSFEKVRMRSAYIQLEW